LVSGIGTHMSAINKLRLENNFVDISFDFMTLFSLQFSFFYMLSNVRRLHAVTSSRYNIVLVNDMYMRLINEFHTRISRSERNVISNLKPS
jgi:hypothetical protein